MKNNVDINKELDKLKNNPVANLVIGNLISKSNNIDEDEFWEEQKRLRREEEIMRRLEKENE